MIKSRSLMHRKGTSEELMKLPTQVTAFIVVLQLHCLLNPRGMFRSFPQFFHTSLSPTEEKLPNTTAFITIRIRIWKTNLVLERVFQKHVDNPKPTE